jgi:hypothetical protein
MFTLPGFFVVAEGFDMFRLCAAAATGRRMMPSGNLSSAKRTSVGWMSGVLSPEGFGSLWLMASVTLGGGDHFS